MATGLETYDQELLIMKARYRFLQDKHNRLLKEPMVEELVEAQFHANQRKKQVELFTSRMIDLDTQQKNTLEVLGNYIAFCNQVLRALENGNELLDRNRFMRRVRQSKAAVTVRTEKFKEEHQEFKANQHLLKYFRP